jgi:hypothetical protein
MRQMLLESLLDFCNCETIFDLSFSIKTWAYKIFGVSSTRMLFVQDNEFISFGENKE